MIDYYLQKQPAAEDRTEIALATLCAMFFNANRGKEQAPRKTKDYLPFFDPWPPDDEYSDIDRSFMEALGK